MIEDTVQVINALFPTEQSFTQADMYEMKLKAKQNKLKAEIKQLLQVEATANETAQMKQSIAALKQQIVDIKKKALHAENTVHNITKDIKSLDQAKKNLTATILLLKRLNMLASGLDQLRAEMSKRNYHDMPAILEAVLQLAASFQEYKTVPQINDLLENVNSAQQEIKRMIFSAFEGAFTTQGVFTGNGVLLNEACLVIDAMDELVRRQLLDWYCDLQLRDYRAVFRNNDEIGNLDNISRRYAWLKRLCKTYDEEQALIFPVGWQVSKIVCERFCSLTKEDVTGLLGKGDLDVKMLIKCLQITLEFEAGLNRRFLSLNDPNAVSQVVTDEIPKHLRVFDGSVSAAFEQYLKLYVETEDKNIKDLLEKFRAKTVMSQEDLSTGVFTASTDLFLFYRQTLASMSKLNTRQPFVELSKSFAKGLSMLCEILQNKIPKEDKRSLSSEDIKVTCLVLNTAEYCQSTTSQLEEKMKDKVEQEFKVAIDLTKEKELFLMLVTTAIQSMVKLVMNTLSNSFAAMIKLPWSAMQNVGDQSEYVNQMNVTLRAQISVIRQLVANQGGQGASSTGQKQFRWFCDKFVDSFVPVFLKNIYSCKPIGEIGAEQLLLDTHAVKTILLDIPQMGADQKVPAPAVYTKFVTKSMAKAETLLKVVLTHLDPPEAILKNYMILCADGAEEEMKTVGLTKQRYQELRDGFQRILELKGVREPEMSQLMEMLISYIQKNSVGTLPPLVATASVSNLAGPTSPVNSSGLSSFTSGLAGTSTKLNENLKKVTGISSMGWLKRDISSSTSNLSQLPQKKK